MRGTTGGLVLALAAVAAVAAGCRWLSEPPRMAELAAATSDYQWRVMADGVVTTAEYQAAVHATIACVRREDVPGLVVEGPVPVGSDGRALIWTTEWGPGDEAAFRRSEAVVARCGSEFSDDIQVVWGYAHRLPEQRRERLRRAVVSCLRDAGVPIAADAGQAAIYRVAVPRGTAGPDAAVRACGERYLSYFVVGVR